jgi:hypothetical protein
LACLGKVLVEALVVEIDEDVFLLVGDHCYEFFDSFREGLFALIVIREVGVKVERFFFF